MKTHVMQCFGRTDQSGNTAIVVEGSTLTEAERQTFARQQDASATVFVDADDDGTLQLDYFYPHVRSPLCLHATLAASAIFLDRLPEGAPLRFLTRLHRQVLEVERRDHAIFVRVNAQACAPSGIDAAEAIGLLRLAPAELIAVRGPASVGSPKLLVEVANEAVLGALDPDLEGIAAWSRRHAVSGMYAVCRVGDGVYAGRNFNHLAPRLEDAATGVAAGALALALERDVTLLQGDALGRPCTLLARFLGDAVLIGGRAVRRAA